MSSKYWFKTKKYGWGFVPISIEGWLATLVLLILLLISVYTNGFFNGGVTGENSLRFIFDLFVISAVFSLAVKCKTKGRFLWGRKAKKR